MFHRQIVSILVALCHSVSCIALLIITCLTCPPKEPNLMHQGSSCLRVSESRTMYNSNCGTRNGSPLYQEGPIKTGTTSVYKGLHTARRANRKVSQGDAPCSVFRDSISLQQNRTTRLPSQHSKGFGSSSVPTLICSFRSSVSELSNREESKCPRTDQLSSSARYSKNKVQSSNLPMAVCNARPVRGTSTKIASARQDQSAASAHDYDYNEAQQLQPNLSDHDLTYIKGQLLLRLSELRASLTSSFTSACSRNSVFSNDFTTTGVFLDDGSHLVASQDEADEDCEVSTNIRSICRDRSNYELLVSAVLNMSEHSAEIADIYEDHDNEPMDEEAGEQDDRSIDSPRNEEDFLASFGPSVTDNQEEDFMASFFSSVSSLSKEQEYHSSRVRKQQPRPRRRKSSELLGALASVFMRKARSNVNKSSDDVRDIDATASLNPRGLIVDFHQRSRSNLAPRHVARGYTASRDRELGRRKSSVV